MLYAMLKEDMADLGKGDILLVVDMLREKDKICNLHLVESKSHKISISVIECFFFYRYVSSAHRLSYIFLLSCEL